MNRKYCSPKLADFVSHSQCLSLIFGSKANQMKGLSLKTSIYFKNKYFIAKIAKENIFLGSMDFSFPNQTCLFDQKEFSLIIF